MQYAVWMMGVGGSVAASRTRGKRAYNKRHLNLGDRYDKGEPSSHGIPPTACRKDDVEGKCGLIGVVRWQFVGRRRGEKHPYTVGD
jgi:hypothetical protein